MRVRFSVGISPTQSEQEVLSLGTERPQRAADNSSQSRALRPCPLYVTFASCLRMQIAKFSRYLRSLATLYQ
jgi:hypothetical protein